MSRSARVGAGRGGRASSGGLIATLALVGVLGLAPGAAANAADPRRVAASELPDPELDGLEAAVAEGLRELRRHVVDRLEQVEDHRSLADSVGELGRAWLAHGELRSAEEVLLVAQRLATRDFRWAYYLGFIRQGAERWDEAARSYERALSIAPGVAPALVRLGQVYGAQGRVEAAEWLFRWVLEDDPSHVAARAALGELLTAVGRYQEGADHLESALERQPGADRLNDPLAAAYRGMGRGELARAAEAQRGDVDVGLVDPLIDGLAELVVGERLHLLRGRDAYRDGRFEEAAAEFRRAAEIDPDSLGARLNLASALRREGKTEAALAEYRVAVELEPASKAARVNLAALLADMGELELALSHLTAVVGLDPEDGRLRLDLAHVLRESGRPEEALEQYDRAAELAPPGEMARFRAAQILSGSGRFAEALERLEAGYELAPNSSLLALSLGRLLASAEDLEVRDGERAVEILTNSPIRRSVRTLETMAMAYAELGRCNQAVDWQSQAWEASLDADRQELAAEMERWVEHYREQRPCRYPGQSAGD